MRIAVCVYNTFFYFSLHSWQIPEDGVPINGELDVKVDFIAPELPGRYISYWRMASSNGAKFGQRVWVLIHVRSTFVLFLSFSLTLSNVFDTIFLFAWLG